MPTTPLRPAICGSDSLSAAFRNLEPDAAVDATGRYDELCAHYAMTPTRTNASIAQENGATESPHGDIKAAIEDALQLRRVRAFDDLSRQRCLCRRHRAHGAFRREEADKPERTSHILDR